jgi:hypothetical protein
MLTVNYVRPRGVALSNVSNEIYGLQFWTLLSLQQTSVLQASLESFLTWSSAAHKTLPFSTGNIACWVTCWSLSLWSVQCPLCSLSLFPLSPTCSGNEDPRSPYSLTSNRCNSQSLPPIQHSAVPQKIQWMSIAIQLQSWHSRWWLFGPKLL